MSYIFNFWAEKQPETTEHTVKVTNFNIRNILDNSRNLCDNKNLINELKKFQLEGKLKPIVNNTSSGITSYKLQNNDTWKEILERRNQILKLGTSVEQLSTQELEIKELKNKINSLELEIKEIKTLVKKLI